MSGPRPWGGEIWEARIRTEPEARVIGGTVYGIFGRGEEKLRLATSREMRLMDAEFHAIGFAPPRKILDAGVGPKARITLEFARRGYDVIGLDASETVLRLAREKVAAAGLEDRVRLVKGDLVDFDLEEKVDMVFCTGTFPHIPAHLGLLVMRNFNRALRDRGIAIIQFFQKPVNAVRLPLREAAYGAFRVLRGKRGWRYVTHQALTEPELDDLRRRSGFVLDHPFWIFQLLRKERMVGVL
jgi:ubiquinone/menaquinone biosynthesis C-methylase UbiE